MSIVGEHTWWYLARASGIVAVVLLVASVVWGIALSTRVSKAIRPAWTLEVHKWLSGLAFCATSLHLLGLYLDGYINFGLAELVVPGASRYRPFAVAVGVFTLYGMLAVQATSWARRHLSRRVWHMVHMTSYGVVWGGLFHAGLAGTDTTNLAYRVLAIVMVVVTVAAVVVRLNAPGRRTTPPRPGRPPRRQRHYSTTVGTTVAAPSVSARRASQPRSGTTRRPGIGPTNGWIDPLIPAPRRAHYSRQPNPNEKMIP